MKYYNRIDDKGRFIGLHITNEQNGQEDTHTYSYLTARKMYQDCGDTMGLERELRKVERR